jgi:hypothetical protein
MPTLQPSERVRTDFAPVLEAIERHAGALAAVVDLVAVRPGYRHNDPAAPAIVLAFRPPQAAHGAQVAGELEARAGVAVWATEASPEEQLRWIAAEGRPQRDPGLERWLRADELDEYPILGSYAPPQPAPPLDPVTDTMRVKLCASPDAGWPVLSEFLSRQVADRLVVGMYHFTAPHVYQALRAALLADPDAELHMVRHPDLGEGGAGVKVADLDGDSVVRRLRKALGDRFDFARTTTGKAGVFGTAYHIKVAVADGQRFWLSSGNWQTSNLPPFDPIGAPDDLPTGFARKYNREYHAVVEHRGLARTFEAYLEHDLATAQAEATPFEVPEVAVPLEPELPDDFAPPRYFPPLELRREIKVQPVLTPDNYAPVVLAMIERATRSVWFQNQYISLLEKNNFDAFRKLVAALLARQQAGLDVRVICRDGMEAKRVDVLLAAGFDPERLRFQAACHNKTLIVDGAEVLIGSHNWSNDGTVSNRDASLLFFDEEIARYFGAIYEVDWDRARPRVRRRQPRVLRNGELPPPGTERAPFSDLFEDGNVVVAPVEPPVAHAAAPAAPAREAELPDEIFPLGLDESGQPITAAVAVGKLAEAIRRRGGGPLSEPERAASARAGLESMGLPVGVTAGDLSRAGWAVVFADDVPAAVRDALAPLLERRARQARTRFKTLVYNRGESARDWLARHQVSVSDITPSRVPYHLLLVGAPASLPFELQYQLDLAYSVGRLWFDDPACFGHYARSLVAYETAAAVPTRRRVLYSGPDNDKATALSAAHLLAPLHAGIEEAPAIAEELGFAGAALIGAAAGKQALLEALHGEARPAMWFSAGHGLRCAMGSPAQRARQGALVTADHPPGGALDPAKALLAAADVRDDARVHGLVAFLFACYGAGTPRHDQFPLSPEELAEPPAIATEAFIAALPQRLLGHAAGGALAVIGHVERAWACSIRPPKVGPQILPFRNAVGRILSGEPVGEATQDLTGRHAVLAAEMVGILAPAALAAKPLGDHALVTRWLEQNDARNYVLLGDPAARLRVGEMT